MSVWTEQWRPANAAAFALAIWPLNVMHKDTLRALLPSSGRSVEVNEANYLRQRRREHSGGGNASRSKGDYVSDKLRRALRAMEKHDLILRGTALLAIRDRRGLADWSMEGVTEIPDHALALRSAAYACEESIRTERLAQMVDVRRQELAAIENLMLRPRGSQWSGAGAARFTPSPSRARIR